MWVALLIGLLVSLNNSSYKHLQNCEECNKHAKEWINHLEEHEVRYEKQ